MVKAIPEGYHTVTPSLIVKDGGAAIEFYKRALGAQELMRFPGPDGKGLMHAELKVGDSIVMLAEEKPEMGCRAPSSVGGATSALYLYVGDADVAFKRAVDAGARVVMPVADMFWGDRMGQIEDPSGHRWTLATHKEDVTPDEMAKRGREFFAKMAQPGAPGQAKK
jgi:PhnB protein